MEIGGYIELDRYSLPMLHEDGIKLNCGRNALAYIIEARGIRKLAMPKFMCDSNNEILRKHMVKVRRYSIDLKFRPVLDDIEPDEWLYIVNFYGQLTNEYLKDLNSIYPNMIVDQAHGYFQEPLSGIDTLYTCRKFFGVADGAILYTGKRLERELEQDESFERMRFLTGRFERSASEFYEEYVENNRLMGKLPIRKMSALTENLLHAIDYANVKKTRTENFAYLHDALDKNNKLDLTVPQGAFMYPYYVDNGAELRKKLQQEKIYIPILWPAVFDICSESDMEFDMAKNILPLPVDQRYGSEDMDFLIHAIKKYQVDVV